MECHLNVTVSYTLFFCFTLSASETSPGGTWICYFTLGFGDHVAKMLGVCQRVEPVDSRGERRCRGEVVVFWCCKNSRGMSNPVEVGSFLIGFYNMGSIPVL